jgi:two-component system, OmpR family, copper resistance phosphate regulon response regulator CusR
MARVLIAEDEPRVALFIEKGLSANDLAVTVVADGSRDSVRLFKSRSE